MIVPIYNAEETLVRCLESIQRQTYPHWEAILVDDGSGDNSSSLCERYTSADRRFSLICQLHRGISAARNTGVKNVMGEYVAFMDADDYAEPQMLEKLYQQICESGADIAACGYYLEKGKSKFSAAKQTENALMDGDKAMIAAMQRNFFQGFLWNKLFCIHLFSPEDAPWFSEQLSVCEDLAFLINCFVRGARISYCAEPLYHYCIRPDSLTQTTKSNRMSELDARQAILKIIPKGNASALRMAQCKYSETAANLQYTAWLQGDNEKVKYYMAEARRYAKTYYKNPQLCFSEKGKFFLKHHAPVMSARIIAIYHSINFFIHTKGR